MASTKWNRGANSSDSFGEEGRLVTPHDTTLLDPIAKSVVVTDITAGSDISVLTAGGSTIAFVGVPVGFIVPYRVARVNDTGTTVTACYTID